jgi:hypothetical protein
MDNITEVQKTEPVRCQEEEEKMALVLVRDPVPRPGLGILTECLQWKI